MKPMLSSLLLAGMVLLALSPLVSCRPLAPVSPPTATSSITSVSSTAPDNDNSIQGKVVDEDGNPVPGATVRIQATTNATKTDRNGDFIIRNLTVGIPVSVSGWKQDYYCALVEKVTPPAKNVNFTLRLYQINDNPTYGWIPPIGENSCYSCKPGVTQVWLENDAHGRSAQNVRFLTMYNGTDVNGNESPPTRFGNSRDYGKIPLRPDPSQPYYGTGYKLDFPDSAGNCAACHTPGAAIDAPYNTDPNSVDGVNTFGVHCDYCHKVADIKLDPATKLPYPNMPGVLSQDIRRPFPKDTDRYQIFFGSFDDDNVPKEDTYLPLIKQSQWCAPCHYGVFWDTVVYNSYGEWLDSPYSNPVNGKTCQQCHMPVPTILDGKPITNVAPDKGGVKRDPMTIPAHTFPGTSNAELLQNSVTMATSARREGGQVSVDVTIVNDKTGHHIPTDSPLRQMILLVSVTDGQGQTLPLLEGSTVPDWGGTGDPTKGYYAGLPGKGYAKILSELWTEFTPSGAYWNPTRVISDNRLAAFESDTSKYVFEATEKSGIHIEVHLLFRRAFKELMDQKGWEVADIVMEESSLLLP